MKGIFFRLIAMGVGLLASFVMIEIGLRVWTPQSLEYKVARKPDPVRHHRLEPSQRYTVRTKEFTTDFETNSMGLRDREWRDESDVGRIVMLGDSFVEGVGVEMEDGVAEQLESRLNANANGEKKYEVFNFGIAGYSPILEYLHLKEAGLALKPDLVILCYDMTDVQEDFAYAQDAEFDSAGVPLRVHPSWANLGKESFFPRSRLKTYIQEYSYLYTLMVDVIKNPRERLTEIRPGDVTSGPYAHTIDSTAERWQTYFAQSQFYVRLVTELCRENDIGFVLSVHPRGHQVNELEWKEGRIRQGLGTGVYHSAIFLSLREFAEQNGIAFLDMSEVFKRKSKGDLYFPLDGHWTARGNTVAADTLFQFLLATNALGQLR